MIRKVFMNKLMGYLKNIPKEERDDIERFYNEMFDEENISDNDEVPEHYGNPKKIAFDIIGDTIEFESENNSNKKQKNSESRFIFDFPIFRIISGMAVFVPLLAVLAVVFALFIVSLVIGILILPFGLLFFPFAYGKSMLIIIVVLTVVSLALWALKLIYKTYRRRNRRKNSSYNSEYYSKNFGNIRIGYYDDEDFDYESVGGEMRYFEDVEKLILDINVLDFRLSESEDDRVVVDTTGIKDESVNINFSEGVLKISKAKEIKTSIFNKIEPVDLEKLRVFVPNGLYLDVELSVGKCDISDLEFEDVKVELNAGTLQLNDVTCEKLNAVLNAGEMKLIDVDSEDLYVNVNAGEMSLTDVNTINLDLNVNAGEAVLNDVAADVSNIELNMGEVRGSTSFDESMDIAVNMGEVNIEVESSEDVKYYIDKSMGSAKITDEFERVNKKRDANLTIEVAMGSVKIR